MKSIFLISSRHRAIGRCNSEELFNIMEQIGPAVIFEELPPSFFNSFYIEKSRFNLESDAISKYIERITVPHIPVDLDSHPSEDFFKSYERLIKRIEGLTSINGFNFRNYIDKHKEFSRLHGFSYLNSETCIKINTEIYQAIEGGLAEIKSEKLIQTFSSWKKINDQRENHMLKRIYEYSTENEYDRAIFILGSAHRRSIIEKIPLYQKKEKVKIDWILQIDTQL